MCTGSAAAAAAAATKPSLPPPMDDDSSSVSLLLELAASDDLPAFLRAVADGTDPAAAAPWYSRSLHRSTMGLHSRTPLHIAALYGSTNVLNYLLSTTPSSATLPSASDSATPLHLAAAGGAPSSPAAVSLLLSASADVDALDAAGRRPADLIPRLSAPRSLDLLLKSTASTPVRTPSPIKKDSREFPPDVTLPDIKNGIYGTDEFRMYTFKVQPCSRAYSHDWTECPFVHPGENARRRDPRKYVYSSIPCPEFRKGACRNGDGCEYAHGVFESWLHPQQYRTRLCKDETGCNRRVCFFAHRHDELRSVNPAAVPPSSPRMSSLDMTTALLMMQQQQQQQPGSPRSPSAPSSPAAWMNQAGSGAASSPTMQLPSSRLKTALAARDMELDLELMGLEGYQQKLISEISSPRCSLRSNGFVSPAASRASEYNDLLGSLDHTMMSQLQGLSMKQTASAAAQYQTSAGMIRGQPMSQQQQLLSGYGGALQASSSLGLEHSTAKAIMNARSAAFAKRSQSFIDHGAVGRNSSGFAPMANPACGMSNWGSPGGKLDWGVQGEELNKLRKSASFATRSNGLGGRSVSPEQARTFDEPDLTWVHSLVKDGPAAPVGLPQQRKQYHQHNGGRDYLAATEMLAPWVEQEQMVA